MQSTWYRRLSQLSQYVAMATKAPRQRQTKREMPEIDYADDDMEDFKMPKKKSGFSAPVSDDRMREIAKGSVLLNTKKNTAWTVNVFLEWCAARNNLPDVQETCPEDLLERADPGELNHWLCKFVTKVRKKDGSYYPPRSIHLILGTLQWQMLEGKPDAPRFFDAKNYCFRELQRACDYVYKDLRSQGIGANVHHTPAFTREEEDKLWATKVMDTSNPKALQRAVFFYVGKCSCIRGGEEQRKLGPSQFLRTYQPKCYTYVEHGSKNKAGDLAGSMHENKHVPCIAVPDQSPRCLVYLLDLYLNKLPQYAFTQDVLYCRPTEYTPVCDKLLWYDPVPVGKNKLGTMIKDVCKDAGIEEKTNHSLRATGASAMFQANVPEKIIQNTTGHRSLEALRKYQHTSMEQHQAVSRLLMSGKSSLFSQVFKQAAEHITWEQYFG